MNQEEIQEFADKHDLDVRNMNWGKNGAVNHVRLIRNHKYILDVYFKNKKNGGVKPVNKVHQWQTGVWTTVQNWSDLEILI